MKKIYLIEDDSFLQKLILRKLSSSNFEIAGAISWNTAEETITDFKPDLLILDLMLPEGMTGFEILKHIRSKDDFKNMKIIVFSNVATSDSEKQAIDLGANAYMVKSNFTLEELIDKVNELTA